MPLFNDVPEDLWQHGSKNTKNKKFTKTATNDYG